MKIVQLSGRAEGNAPRRRDRVLVGRGGRLTAKGGSVVRTRVCSGFVVAAIAAASAILPLSSSPPAQATTTSKATMSHGLVNVRVLPGPRQFGINIRWSYYPESQHAFNSQVKTTINYVKSLGANSVAVAFDIYVNSPKSNTVIAGPGTPPPSLLGQLIAVARLDGLFVLLRPLITETNANNPWRGEIAPTNRTAWFRSYDNFLKPYLEVARANGANEIAYSCELSSLGGDPRWKSTVVPYFKKYFNGALMYNASWYPPGMKPMAGETYGIDAYPAMDLPDSATVSQILHGWEVWLARFPLQAAKSKIYIVEAGISAQSHAYTHPSQHNWGTPIIPSIQSKWFQAACDFFNKYKFKSLYYFSTSLTVGPQLAPEGGTPADFQGQTPPVIKRCFTGS
jgi:hypothetical protein